MAIDTDELNTTPGEGDGEHAEPHIEEVLREAEESADVDDTTPPSEFPVRMGLAVAMPTIAAGIMVGGIFEGISPRIYAVIAGLLGIGLAALCSRLMRRPGIAYVVMITGIFAIGLLMLLPDVGDMFKVSDLVSAATAETSLQRPPVPFVPGWHAVIGWVMAITGFVAAWTAVVVGARSIGLLIPLPVAAIAGISVPQSQQVASGAAVLVLFAVGLGLLSSQNEIGDDDSINPGVGYELRRAAKALPLIIVLVVALVFGKDQLAFLFPDPLIDPAQEPQKPKTRPLTEVEIRVLFEVRDPIIGGDLIEAPTGPWRTGVLDVYDGESWRLPPFALSDAAEIDNSGVLDPNNAQVAAASITVRGLGGQVMPSLPNPAVIATQGVKVGYDPRTQTVRVVNGAVPAGLQYIISAAAVPSVGDLRALDAEGGVVPDELVEFTDIPEPPPAVVSLLEQSRTAAASEARWDRFDWLRTWVLDNVTASGAGTPVDVPPARVEDMIAGSQTGSPFEIVAAQAMLARWLGVPARIGFGFDGGNIVDDHLEVTPLHGAAWVEVNFGEFGWLPVIGTPKKAEPSVGSDPSLQRFDPTILPGNEIGTNVFIPLIVDPDSVLAEQIALGILSAVPFILLGVLIYFASPLFQKLILRGRRRRRALEAGVRARVALAYSEFRDYATDLGYRYPTDTPLMFLERVMDDEEHRELAWLVTRVLWGDLRNDENILYATTAEELARSLRSRLGAAQPGSVRAIAAISRLSLRDPFDPAHEGERVRRRTTKVHVDPDVADKRSDRDSRRAAKRLARSARKAEKAESSPENVPDEERTDATVPA